MKHLRAQPAVAQITPAVEGNRNRQAGMTSHHPHDAGALPFDQSREGSWARRDGPDKSRAADSTHFPGPARLLHEWIQDAPGRRIWVTRDKEFTRYRLQERCAPPTLVREYRTAVHHEEPREAHHLRVRDAIRALDCHHCCAYVEPYGWVPECGCPVHDGD